MNCGIKTNCEACEGRVLGVLAALEKIDGRYLCPACAEKARNPGFTKCQHCDEYISSRATSCTKCGAPQMVHEQAT
ncbi:MAG: hypothetical protein ABSE48_17720 [Verrucomicrobiota bacterium]